MNNHQRKLNYEGIKVPAEGRVLIIVPILHTKEDMGSLGNHLPMTDGYTAVVSDFWQEVKEAVMQYINGITRVKIYQDGLPDTQEKLVGRILSEVQSPNYELLRFLKEKGAKVLGTENPQLLKEEYKFTSGLVRSQENTSDGDPQGLLRGEEVGVKATSLLAQRDTYIANRIDNTLSSGELGILFIGASHDVKKRLPANIKIEIL